MFCLSWSARATRNTSRDSWPHFHAHVISFRKSPLQICRVSHRIWCLLFAPISRPCWNRKCEGTRGDKHSCCATPNAHTAHAFTYCYWLAVYGTSLETFWYTNTLLEILFSSILCTCPNQCNLFNLIFSIVVGFLTLAYSSLLVNILQFSFSLSYTGPKIKCLVNSNVRSWRTILIEYSL